MKYLFSRIKKVQRIPHLFSENFEVIDKWIKRKKATCKLKLKLCFLIFVQGGVFTIVGV